MKHRIISFMMTLVMLFSIVVQIPVTAATNPTWTKTTVSNLSDVDAKIGAKVTFSSKVQFSAGGFYIGTSKDSLKKNAYPDSSTTNATSTTFTFLMSKYKETLKPNTTYYYQIYVVAGGKEYKSPTYSFKTNPSTSTVKATWTKTTVSNLSDVDAKIGAKVTFTSKVQFSAGGFYIGTSKDNLKKNAYPDSSTTNATSTTFTFLMSKYKETLKPNTTYYYQIYVVAGGKEYKSPTYSFKTNPSTSTVKSTWTKTTVSNLSNADAKIGAKVVFDSKVQFSAGGFYIGTSKDNLKKNAYPDSSTTNATSTTFTFLMTKYKEKLKADTTYYYQIYVVANGKEYKSPTYSFKTKPDVTPPTWTKTTITNLSNADAKIGAKVAFTSKVQFSAGGFYIGTSKDNLKKNAYPDSSTTNAKSTTFTFLMSKYKETLKADTTYYYQIYVVAGGKEYKSPTYSFKTPPGPTTTVKATWTKTPVTNLTSTNAKIGAKVTFTSKVKFSQGGFYIGTSQDNLKKNAYPDSSTTNAKSTTFTFLMSKYKETLKPNTTYYYQIYVVAGGKEYKSDVYSFKTDPVPPAPSVAPTWKMTAVTNLSSTDAKIGADIDFGSKVQFSQCGFYIGTSRDNLTKNAKYDKTTTKAKSIGFTFLLSKYYKSLEPGTTYYYQIYIVANGKEYKSSTYSFATQARSEQTTQLYFPLQTKDANGKTLLWNALTYSTHGNKSGNKSAYAAIDLNYGSGDDDKGLEVYSMADGVIHRYDKANGQITIKYKTKLITTNGAKYETWYATYAHMSNIPKKFQITELQKDKVRVAAGELIGRVSSVYSGDKTISPHLHLSIGSGNGGSGWNQKTNTAKAISPFYIWFVDKNDLTTVNINFTYSTKSANIKAMLNRVINNPPSGK